MLLHSQVITIISCDNVDNYLYLIADKKSADLIAIVCYERLFMLYFCFTVDIEAKIFYTYSLMSFKKANMKTDSR